MFFWCFFWGANEFSRNLPSKPNQIDPEDFCCPPHAPGIRPGAGSSYLRPVGRCRVGLGREAAQQCLPGSLLLRPGAVGAGVIFWVKFWVIFWRVPLVCGVSCSSILAAGPAAVTNTILKKTITCPKPACQIFYMPIVSATRHRSPMLLNYSLPCAASSSLIDLLSTQLVGTPNEASLLQLVPQIRTYRPYLERCFFDFPCWVESAAKNLHLRIFRFRSKQTWQKLTCSFYDIEI